MWKHENKPQGNLRGQNQAQLITMGHMSYDALLRADSSISLKRLKTSTQLITFAQSCIPMRNLPAYAWYQ